jgi:hypothetical protein
VASSIEWEELFGYLEGGEIGHGLFGSSPLTSPKPTPPPSPAQKPTSLGTRDLPPFPSLFSPDVPLLAPPAFASTPPEPSEPGIAENVHKKHRSNKQRSRKKRARDREDQRKAQEGHALPYEVRPATRQKHVHTSKNTDAKINMAGIPISLPGYIGLRGDGDKTAYRLDDVTGEGSRFKFKLQKWNGRYVAPALPSPHH